ncbi:MAG TPA: AAA family ATPase, partial [Myxococcota bacterium]|nr:AAA family ATPase [Myxococcota bacterium]
MPGRQANREHLLNLLWADRDPPSARHALRQTVWYVRQRLGEAAITVRDEQVILTAPVECDRDRFLAAIEAGNVVEATEIYGGDFLPGFAVPGAIAFDQWAEAEGRRLRTLFRHAAESLARESLAQGRFRAARDLARRVRDADPLDESGWRLLIETCLVQDDRVSAMAEGQRLHQLLAAEERTPDPATQALLRRANAQPEEIPRPDEGALVAELVGREREFSALLTAFQQARNGASRVCSLVAPPGLGKTRLLRDLARRLEGGGSPAVYVRAQPGDRDIPGSYVAEVARQLASRPGARGVSPASAGALVALDPSISSLLAATPDASTGDEARRRRVVALAELIESVAVEHPLALLLDDVHWADGYSRDALEHAVSRARGTRVLVVLAARPDAALRGLEPDLDFELAPLSVEEVDALVCSLGTLPDAPWARAFATRLESATGGSPLLLLETLQLAIETGWLDLAEGRWSCPDEGVLGALLEGGSALARRVEQLDRSQFWVLLLLALSGAALPVEIIASASARDRGQTLADLNVLERRGLVSRHHGGWAISHDETAERAEEHSSAVQTRAAHEALGRALLQAPAQPGALRAAARHLAAAAIETEMVTVATNWVRAARAGGDRRSARLVVADLLGAPAEDARVGEVLRTLPWGVRTDRRWRLAGAGVAGAAAVVALVAALTRSGTSPPGVLMATWSQEASGHWRMLTRELTARDVARGTVAVSSFRPTGLGWDRPEGLLRPGSPQSFATTGTFDDSGGEEVVLAAPG